MFRSYAQLGPIDRSLLSDLERMRLFARIVFPWVVLVRGCYGVVEPVAQVVLWLTSALEFVQPYMERLFSKVLFV